MSKIALVTDTHFGARSDSDAFDKFFRKFYEEVFFPRLIKDNIKTIIHLGDCFDRRKYINFSSLKNCREYFFDKANALGIQIHMIVGNHDTFYKNTNNVNSPELLLNDYSNIITYSSPTTISIDNNLFLMLPWICTDNYDESMEQIKRTKAEVCFAHLELEGFQMWKGQDSHDGFDPAIFSKFKRVCTGHFHHRHTKGNITYLGNPYQMYWNDYADPRGFHLFDTKSYELEFIDNPFMIFEKLYYDDAEPLPDPKDYTDMVVKVIVVYKSDHGGYDKYMDSLYKANPIEVKIIEDFSEFETDLMDDESVDLTDTMTLLSQYVDALETDVNKDKLKLLMKTLYVEAQDSE